MKKHIKQRAKTGSSVLSIAPLVLTGITTIIGLILSSSVVSATNDSVVDQVNITVPVSCTMTGTGMNTHNAEIANGTYTPNIGTTTLHAFCNDNEGFAIYATGYTGDTIGETNSNKLVGTSASSNATIDSGLATSPSNPDVSNWAMKLTMTQDSGDTTGTNAFTIDSAPNVDLPSEAEQSATQASFSQYHVVPNEYVKVAHKNSMTDMTTTTGGVKLTTTYAAYVSKTQPADTYSGQVIYTLVHPATEPAPIVCKPNGTTISTIVCMQDITSSNKTSVLASMTEDNQYQLYDSRDGKQYYVAKLRDGNVWMTQNLDLDLDSSKTYTAADTDLPAGVTWVPEKTTSTDINSWNSSDYSPDSYDPGALYWNGDTWPEDQQGCESAGGIWDEGWCNSLSLTSSNGDSHYYLGNYYNWTAAIAMNDSWGIQSKNQFVDQSICPAGWTMPLAESGEKSFSALWDEYGFDSSSINGADNLWSSPLFFVPGGGISFGSYSFVGYTGDYWLPATTSMYAQSYAKGVGFDTSGSIGNSGGERSKGLSVRCVVR